jgi:hypothetical protein
VLSHGAAKRRFKLVSHTCESGCIDTYRTPDRKEVSLEFACYTGDAAGAREEIARLTSEGRVIRFSRRGPKGKSQRTVMLHPREHGKRRATIFWYGKDDSCFTQIDADSLPLALEFERSQMRKEPLSAYVK